MKKTRSFNVLNYFTTLNARGAKTEVQRQDQLAKITKGALALQADVIAIVEVENDYATDTPSIQVRFQQGLLFVWRAIARPILYNMFFPKVFRAVSLVWAQFLQDLKRMRGQGSVGDGIVSVVFFYIILCQLHHYTCWLYDG